MTHIGILGAGNISETHARAAREIEGVQIGAVCGFNVEKAQRLAERYGGVAYHELESFLAHRPLDVILIGSPSGVHAEQGTAAAERSLHILVEKPIDVTTERADALIAACQSAGVKLGVFFQDRVASGVGELKNLLVTEQLGRPFLVSARVRWYRPSDYYDASKWRGTRRLDGGGALINQGIHTVDLLLFLLGDIKRVFARKQTALHDIEVEDTIVATLEFANGVIGTLEATTAAFPGYSRVVEVSGTEGTAIIRHDELISVDLRRPYVRENDDRANANLSASSPVVSDVSGHRKILEDFLAAIKENRRPLCDGPEGRRSVEVVQAIYQSAESGLPVNIRD